MVYLLYENPAMGARIQLQHYYTHVFPECSSRKATCCDISSNERYIAVGFQTGLICVSDSSRDYFNSKYTHTIRYDLNYEFNAMPFVILDCRYSEADRDH